MDWLGSEDMPAGSRYDEINIKKNYFMAKDMLFDDRIGSRSGPGRLVIVLKNYIWKN